MSAVLQKAESQGGTVVQLTYTDGFSAVLDLAPVLHGPVFQRAKDPHYFRRFRVESGTLRWPNGADIDPSVLRFWAEEGQVRSQPETDAHFSRILT